MEITGTCRQCGKTGAKHLMCGTHWFCNLETCFRNWDLDFLKGVRNETPDTEGVRAEPTET